MSEGTILRDRYRLEQLLGRGGMADVYLAFDLRRQVYIAIKLLREDLAEDPEFVRRFQREAEALARLDHPYVVRFYSFERQGATAFIVMDYVPGTTLRGRIMEANGPLPLTEITNVMRQVGSALQYAHNEGFIHRDIKPGNIMLRDDGSALLSDFGIARATEASTMTLGPLGTPAYMSPEQIMGREADPRTDGYCLGVVLFEMATGRRPFVGETGTGTSTTERMRFEHLHVPPTDPRTFNRTLPAAAAQVVLRALAKDPAERWPDVMSFVRSWEAALGLEHESISGRDAATVVRLPGQPVTGRTATPPRQQAAARQQTPPRQAVMPAPPLTGGWQPAAPPPVVRRKRGNGLIYALIGAAVLLLGGGAVCAAYLLREPTATPTATTERLALDPTATGAADEPTPVPTDTVSPDVPTATAAWNAQGRRSAEGILRVASDTAWAEDQGGISIVGEVYNDSNETIGSMVVIEALLTDASGSDLTGDFSTYLDRPVLPPGEKSSFWLLVTEEDLPVPADQVTQYQLQLWILKDKSPDVEILVDSGEASEEGDALYIRGQATNTTDLELVAISVYSTLYGADGGVMNATVDQIELDPPLKPGESTQFEGYFPSHFTGADSYYVFVTGWTADQWSN